MGVTAIVGVRAMVAVKVGSSVLVGREVSLGIEADAFFSLHAGIKIASKTKTMNFRITFPTWAFSTRDVLLRQWRSHNLHLRV